MYYIMGIMSKIVATKVRKERREKNLRKNFRLAVILVRLN